MSKYRNVCAPALIVCCLAVSPSRAQQAAPGQPADAAQVALTKSVRNMPRSFRVMLYGFSSSENNRDSVRVITTK